MTIITRGRQRATKTDGKSPKKLMQLTEAKDGGTKFKVHTVTYRYLWTNIPLKMAFLMFLTLSWFSWSYEETQSVNIPIITVLKRKHTVQLICKSLHMVQVYPPVWHFSLVSPPQPGSHFPLRSPDCVCLLDGHHRPSLCPHFWLCLQEPSCLFWLPV